MFQLFNGYVSLIEQIVSNSLSLLPFQLVKDFKLNQSYLFGVAVMYSNYPRLRRFRKYIRAIGLDNIREVLVSCKKLNYGVASLVHSEWYAGITEQTGIVRFEGEMRDGLRVRRDGGKSTKYASFMSRHFADMTMFPTHLDLVDFDKVELSILRVDDPTLNTRDVPFRPLQQQQALRVAPTKRKARLGAKQRRARGFQTLPCHDLPQYRMYYIISAEGEVLRTSFYIYSIFDFISKCDERRRSSLKVGWLAGRFDLSCFWRLEKTFTKCLFIMLGGEVLVGDMVSLLKYLKGSDGQFTVLRLENILETKRVNCLPILNELVKAEKNEAFSVLQHTSTRDLLSLWASIGVLRIWSDRQKARPRIFNVLRTRDGCPSLGSVRMTCTYFGGVNRELLRKLAIVEIRKSKKIPKVFKKFLSRGAKVVLRRAKTGKAVLENGRALERSFERSKPPECICDSFPADFPRVDDHVVIRGTDLAKTDFCPSSLIPVFTSNWNNTLQPKEEDMATIIWDALRDFRRQLGFRGKEMTYISPATAEAIDAVVFTRKKTTSVISTFELDRWLSAKRWLKKLRAAVVIMDHNQCVPAISCPQRQWILRNRVYELDLGYPNSYLFAGDHPTFTLTRDEALLEIMEDYKMEGFEKYAKLDMKGQLASGSTYVKQKDMSRGRPVVGGSKTPDRAMSRLVSKGLNFLISKVIEWKLIKHFSLRNVGDLTSVIERINRRHDLDFPDLELNIYSGDVKQMFTEIDMPHVLQSVKRLFELVKSKKRKGCSSVVIPISKANRKKIRFGTLYGKVPGFVVLPLTAMYRFIKFEYFHPYFTLGKDVLVEQSGGLTMGKSTSPPLSDFACMTLEDQHIDETPEEDQGLENPFRYVDDMSSVDFVPLDAVAKARAKARLTKLIKSFKEKNMILKEQPVVNNTIIFLEAEIAIEGKSVAVRYHNKNFPCEIEGRQNLVRFKHFQCHSDARISLSVVISTIHRILSYSLLPFDSVRPIFQVFAEFIALGYPVKVLAAAVNNRINRDRTNVKVWELIKGLLISSVGTRIKWR